MWSPLVRRHLSTTFYGLYFSHHHNTNYTLQIMLDLLCGQLYMYCTLDTSSLWDLGTPHDAILVFCGL